MDSINDKLSEILNDPKSMEKVRRMAENLLGDEEENEDGASDFSGEGMPSPAELQKIMGLVSSFKSTGNDKRTKLLLALKPNLSPDRQEKVDTAIKLLRLIEILPQLKESGILNI